MLVILVQGHDTGHVVLKATTGYQNLDGVVSIWEKSIAKQFFFFQKNSLFVTFFFPERIIYKLKAQVSAKLYFG